MPTKPSEKQLTPAHSAEEMTRIMTRIAERSAPVIQKYWEKQAALCAGNDPRDADPMNIGQIWAEFMRALAQKPEKYIQMQTRYWQEWTALYQNSLKSLTGAAPHISQPAPKGDRRFRDEAWSENALFNFIKQSYLLTGRYVHQAVREADSLDPHDRNKLDFFLGQYVDALSPSNFIHTNPEVLKVTIESNGENLLRGLENLLGDLERGAGELHISMTDYENFEPGQNVAVTPGRIVYQNEMMQLIQYDPATKQVFKRPLLIVPPWINKYYILDLREDNSFIRWAVEQGHTVFVISWVNPDETYKDKRFEDYLDHGIMAALAQIEAITGEPDVNAIGYCIGGTLLTMALAWMTANGMAGKVASATFFTTLVDFEQAGELKIFIDERQLDILDRKMERQGYLDARSFQKTFSALRANDLIWSFVVNNYLLGRQPFPFDLLYWNDDSTNMPARMHSDYLRNMYLENNLIKPGGISLHGTPLDVRNIKTPAYFISTRDDHIAPWKATYAATQLLSGPVRFTLAASGHIAGVVNPPKAGKYCFWTGEDTPADPEAWLSDATQKDGSWWPYWAGWIGEDFGGPKVPARKPGKGLEPAPGGYVKKKA